MDGQDSAKLREILFYAKKEHSLLKEIRDLLKEIRDATVAQPLSDCGCKGQHRSDCWEVS